MNRVSLTGLNYDVLRQICVSTKTGSMDALKTLSCASRLIRDISIPLIFEAAAISGDENFAHSRLKVMKQSPLLVYIRSISVGVFLITGFFLTPSQTLQNQDRAPG